MAIFSALVNKDAFDDSKEDRENRKVIEIGLRIYHHASSSVTPFPPRQFEGTQWTTVYRSGPNRRINDSSTDLRSTIYENENKNRASHELISVGQSVAFMLTSGKYFARSARAPLPHANLKPPLIH